MSASGRQGATANGELILAEWDHTSGVRSSPRKILHEATCAQLGHVLFPARLVPHLSDSLLPTLDTAQFHALLAQQLYQYLLFTAHLEMRVVNRAVMALATGRAGLDTNIRLQVDAAKIYTDEAYHALYTLDLVEQVSRNTGIPPVDYSFMPVVENLDRVSSEHLADHLRLAELLQVVIFETMVTAILADIPGDTTLCGSVRAVVADHASDEKRHHAYFARLFPEIWASLDAPLRNKARAFLPAGILACLAPDVAFARNALASVGVPVATVEAVIREAYDEGAVRQSARLTARHTIRLFRDTGVLDSPLGEDAFATARLYP